MNVYLLNPDPSFDNSFFSYDLGDRTYRFRMTYNYRLSLFVIDVFDTDGNHLAAAPLINNVPLFYLYEGGTIWPGDLMLYNNTGDKKHCGKKELNTSHLLGCFLYEGPEQ